MPPVFLLILLAGPVLLTPSPSQELEVRGQRTPRDMKQDSIKVVISEGCTTQAQSSDSNQEATGKEVDLAPGSPLVLTHRIKLVPSGSGLGSGSCGCEADLAALRGRLERLEREVSALREKCGGAEGGCCTTKESKGAGCSIKPETGECPNECSDQGRCEDGKCVCFPGFSGPDCSQSNCPENCNDSGRCVNGQCVCDPGFTGPACSQRRCPDDCNNRGRCVNGRCVCDGGFAGPSCSDELCLANCHDNGRCVSGRCVCDPGFTGPDCSERSCPDSCNNRGRCVNGRCVCDSGFTGDDCSEKSCPNNCSSRGRCVNGRCSCDDGLTGADCSQKTCPNACSNRGRCVDGKCVCNVGFSGPDCAAKACPNNCNNKGRCLKGRCVCRRGFTGSDCGQCEEKMTGPNCNIVMSGVSHLSVRDVTETSVTVVWTPPPVQYETYHVTFTSQKEGDQQITAQVEGSLTSFTQTGLAAGQEYTITITGETDGRKGAESSANFMTLISGPANLHVVKMTTTSTVVQWEQSHGEIDRYRLTVSPSDGAGRSQEMTIPPGRDSAHIEHLEAGRLYDIVLVAEKGSGRSEPSSTQATPGKMLPRVAVAAATTQVTPAPGRDLDNRDRLSNHSAVFDGQGMRKDESEVRSVDVGGGEESSVSVPATTTTTPLVGKDGAKPKLAERPLLSRKPGFFRFNATRPTKGRKFGPGPLKKPVVGMKKKAPDAIKQAKPGFLITGDRKLALTERDPSVETSSTEQVDDENPALISAGGSDSGTKDESSSVDSTVTFGSEEQPDVGVVVQPGDPMFTEPTETVPGHEKKCMNKIKVTHIRLPPKDRGIRCRSDGTVLKGWPTSDEPSSAETEPDYTPDPLHQLMSETFDTLNITTFSVHLAKTSNLSVNAETVRKQILSRLRPLSSFSSSSSSSSKSQSSSSLSTSHSFSPSSSSLPTSQSPSPPPSSTTSSTSASTSSLRTSQPPSSLPLAATPSSLTSLISSSPSSSPSPPPLTIPSSSSSSSSSEKLSESTTPENDTIRVPETNQDRKKDGILHFRRTSPRPGYSRRPWPKIGMSQNRTRPNFRGPYHSSVPLTTTLGTETKTGHASTNRSSPLPSSSSSEAPHSVDGNVPERETSVDTDEATTVTSFGLEQNQKQILREGKAPTFSHVTSKGGYQRRPHPKFGAFFNRTRPNLRLPARPSQSLNPDIQTEKENVSSSGQRSSSSSSSTALKEDMDGMRTNQGPELSPTQQASGPPLFNRTASKFGYSQPYVGTLQNRTRTNLRPPQHPRRVPIRRPLPPRRLNGGSGHVVQSLTSQSGKLHTFRIPSNQSGEQEVQMSQPRTKNQEQDSSKVIQRDQATTLRMQTSQSGGPEALTPTQAVTISPSGDQDASNIIENGHFSGRDSTLIIQTSQSGDRQKTPIQTSEFREKETITVSDSISNIHKNNGAVIPSRPVIKRPSDPGHRALKPVTIPNRKPQTGRRTEPGHTKTRSSISLIQRGRDSETDHTVKREQASKNKPTTGSKTLKEADVSPSGDTREHLDDVGPMNLTSDKLMLVWDAPEGKHQNFDVTQNERDGSSEDPKEEKTKIEWREEEEEEEEKEMQESSEETEEESRRIGEENIIPESVVTHAPRSHIIKTGSDRSFKKVLPGSAHSVPAENLPPQPEYTVTFLGKGRGLLSGLHKLVISTGPEPPADVVFSDVTENSLTVSWTKPKSSISGFKVTYTHSEDGEPVSVSVGSEDSALDLSQLSPGSTYEVSIMSILGLDESDPVTEFVRTLPDPPMDLRAINVTDTNALLLWRPALARVEKYAIVYGAGTGSELRVTVSGNAAEHQLSGLEGSTTYTVTITSQLGGMESSPSTSTFTTARGSWTDGDGPSDLQARQVTPRTTLLSWKPPLKPVGKYRLTYQTEGQEMKEVVVDSTVTEFNLSRLHPGSKYIVQLQAEGGGSYSAAIATEFTTGTLRFPYPTDCSQEMLNGIRTSGVVEIFPHGKHGVPAMVYCDMETDGGGWTVFQRRKDGGVDFFRNWRNYSGGFGDLNGEFWLGLESLHNLTTMTRMSLRVDLRAGDESAFAKYSTFEVAKKNYRLSVSGYSGNAGDSLSYHNNRVFSTWDRDRATFITRCAMSYRGGWWYKNCHEANLNGKYGANVSQQGVIWTTWKGKAFSIPFTEMKMRPAAFNPPPTQ